MKIVHQYHQLKIEKTNREIEDDTTGVKDHAKVFQYHGFRDKKSRWSKWKIVCVALSFLTNENYLGDYEQVKWLKSKWRYRNGGIFANKYATLHMLHCLMILHTFSKQMELTFSELDLRFQFLLALTDSEVTEALREILLWFLKERRIFYDPRQGKQQRPSDSK